MRRGLSAGFSYTELLVVVAVGAIIVAVAVPQVRSSVAGHRLSTSARQLATELNVARNIAVSRLTVTRVGVQGTTYQVLDEQDADTPPRSPKTLEEGITFAATPTAAIRFFSRGHARGGTYVLQNGQGVQISVAVGGSGLVSVGDMAVPTS